MKIVLSLGCVCLGSLFGGAFLMQPGKVAASNSEIVPKVSEVAPPLELSVVSIPQGILTTTGNGAPLAEMPEIKSPFPPDTRNSSSTSSTSTPVDLAAIDAAKSAVALIYQSEWDAVVKDVKETKALANANKEDIRKLKAQREVDSLAASKMSFAANAKKTAEKAPAKAQPVPGAKWERRKNSLTGSFILVAKATDGNWVDAEGNSYVEKTTPRASSSSSPNHLVYDCRMGRGIPASQRPAGPCPRCGGETSCFESSSQPNGYQQNFGSPMGGGSSCGPNGCSQNFGYTMDGGSRCGPNGCSSPSGNVMMGGMMGSGSSCGPNGCSY